MNTAAQVDELINMLKAGGIPLSEAAWKTALACVGWSYVYSAWGAECTPSERRKRYGMCPSKTTIKTKCKAFDGGSCSGCQWYPDGKRTRCFDCRGFTDWILKQYGFDLYGDTCGTQYNHKDNWCAKGKIGIDPIPQNVLVNVFINDGSKFTHTGFYYNGSTCECSSGVQYFEKMKQNRWTHWAIAKCFASGWSAPTTEPQKEPEKQPEKGQQTVNRPTIRKGNKNVYVKQVQEKLIALGYNLGICGADGDFGTATENAVKQFQRDHGLTADGVVGTKTYAALDAAEKPAKEQTYTVTIRNLKKDKAEELVRLYGGEMAAE